MNEVQLLAWVFMFATSIVLGLWIKAECTILQLERKLMQSESDRLADLRELDYLQRHARGMEEYIDGLDRD